MSVIFSGRYMYQQNYEQFQSTPSIRANIQLEYFILNAIVELGTDADSPKKTCEISVIKFMNYECFQQSKAISAFYFA